VLWARLRWQRARLKIKNIGLSRSSETRFGVQRHWRLLCWLLALVYDVSVAEQEGAAEERLPLLSVSLRRVCGLTAPPASTCRLPSSRRIALARQLLCLAQLGDLYEHATGAVCWLYRLPGLCMPLLASSRSKV